MARLESDRIALSFLPIGTPDFAFTIYRKELDSSAQSVPGMRNLPRNVTQAAPGREDARSRYAVSLEQKDGYEQLVINAWTNQELTKEVLYKALLRLCKTEKLLGEVECAEGQFTDKVAFILARHEEGIREVVWVRPYALKIIGRFGFLVDFALRVPLDAKVSDTRRLHLSLTQKNGRVNQDFYLDRYGRIEGFLNRYYSEIQTLPLHDGTALQVEPKLSVIRSFGLAKRVFIFANDKEGKSPFFGVKNYGPLRAGRPNTRFVFFFLESDRPKSQDLFRALRGETYSTFPGMQPIFRMPFGKGNVSGIEVQGFTDRDIQAACSTLRAQFCGEEIIPVVLAPMSKHTSETDTRQYFRAKHAFLAEGLSSQFIDRKRMNDRTSLRWSISNIALGLFAKMGGTPWQLKPSTARCLIVGIGQAHTSVNDKVERYFAYSVLTDSSGLYESLRLLGDSRNPDEYYENLTSNLRKVLLEHKDRYDSFVLHLTFSMKKREITAIKDLLREMKQSQGLANEFVALKFNDKNDYFAFSVEHNSRIPYEGVVAPLSRKDFLVWFAGLSREDSKAPKQPERPVHVQVLYPEQPLPDNDLRRVLQDSVNIAGANWRGFNAKSMPISVYYAKLIAEYYAHFREENLPEIQLETLSPWFL